jgi:hypothetical protein
MKQSEPPPTAIIVGAEWLVAQPYFEAKWQTTIDSLGKAKVWHQLGKRRPAITRAQLIDELSKWSWGQMPDSVIEELSKSRKVEVPNELSDKDVALLTAFIASFTLAVSDVRTYTRSDLKEIQECYRQEAQSVRNEAAILKKHGRGGGKVLNSWPNRSRKMPSFSAMSLTLPFSLNATKFARVPSVCCSPRPCATSTAKICAEQ